MAIFFFNITPTTEIYTLSLHDALPISFRFPFWRWQWFQSWFAPRSRLQVGPELDFDRPLDAARDQVGDRSEEHTSELQSRRDLVCRLLLEKKKYTAAQIKWSGPALRAP